MEKKTSKNILLAIMGVLILAEVVIGIVTLSEQYLFADTAKLIPLVFVALYGFWLYKKPHGNMLKYAMLLLAVTQILISVDAIKGGVDTVYGQTVSIVASAILFYVAGRLDRIEQNKYLLPISFAVYFVRDLSAVISLSAHNSLAFMLTWFSGAITTLTLMIAYFVRYKEHKEAGLMDAPKAE